MRHFIWQKRQEMRQNVVVPALIDAFGVHLMLALIHLSLSFLLGITPKGHLNLLIITLREALHVPSDLHIILP